VNNDNANRLFDSQNNQKGGYCWGPTMTYYEQSYIQIEWTNQHGCGQAQMNVDCDIIIQYMCDPNIRDGETTDTITQANMAQTDANGDLVYGQHEPYPNYRACNSRSRNQGLFSADQGNLQGQPATFTRQDNAGDAHGFECAEERDYYPYWHPTPWKDIAVFTSNPARCSYFLQHSQNVESKWWCASDATDSANVEQFNNPTQCPPQYWVSVQAWNLPPPQCFPAGWNRDNHLGNGVGGYANTYKWVLPSMLDIGQTNWLPDTRPGKAAGTKIAPCVLRIRYNISSDDYRGGVENVGNGYANGGFADYTMNAPASPITQNPYVLFGKKQNSQDQPWYLRLAVDTSQFSRTFQDRTHTFYITNLPIGHVGPIYNLMVRGKRGNIVQTYPAVEYDFTPNNLNVNLGDWIHFQWTGCDTNAAGSDGQGIDQTDRSNFVLLKSDDGRTNYPLQITQSGVFGDLNTQQATDTAFTMAYINQYGNTQCASQTDTNCCYTLEQLQNQHPNDANGMANDPQNCFILNAVNANYFDGGLQKMTTGGTFAYMSSRNNAFTNRSQKGFVTISSALSPVALAATVVGAAGFVAAGVIAGGSWYAASHPGSSVANCFSNIKA